MKALQDQLALHLLGNLDNADGFTHPKRPAPAHKPTPRPFTVADFITKGKFAPLDSDNQPDPTDAANTQDGTSLATQRRQTSTQSPGRQQPKGPPSNSRGTPKQALKVSFNERDFPKMAELERRTVTLRSEQCATARASDVALAFKQKRCERALECHVKRTANTWRHGKIERARPYGTTVNDTKRR